MSPRTIQRVVKRVASRAAITRVVPPHLCRHTFACSAVQKGISLPALQRLLGHDQLEHDADLPEPVAGRGDQ